MTEWVTVTPLGGKDPITGDQLPDGAPLRLMAYEVAPGNTLLRFGVGGDLDSVEFTTYLPLRHRGADGAWEPSAAVLSKPFRIEVRDRNCLGRMQEWNSRGRGGIAVLCHSGTGKGA
ncbi:hypothetical protein D2E98_13380 [Mycobacteroides abscessus]|uniref:hypothetical protein n=1 Tax=Mycobacteroides TaxID=670516 RepID=UPI000926977B|nr:hypothetical protein [Mycobacteroides abscessus]RIT43360.1 hypothetical protein D2E98_13380 [Mycobacteroides abscessus]SID45190.1 Uncharacterised protein [Mycobacteroides abscessus subsp. abscessus]